jgi:hypothetical protein
VINTACTVCNRAVTLSLSAPPEYACFTCRNAAGRPNYPVAVCLLGGRHTPGSLWAQECPCPRPAMTPADDETGANFDETGANLDESGANFDDPADALLPGRPRLEMPITQGRVFNPVENPIRKRCTRHAVWTLVCLDCNPRYAGDDAISPSADAAWKRLEARIIRRDGRQCKYCGKRERLTVHHILPRAHGGSNGPDNLMTLCTDCHNEAERRADERDEPRATNLQQAELAA